MKRLMQFFIPCLFVATVTVVLIDEASGVENEAPAANASAAPQAAAPASENGTKALADTSDSCLSDPAVLEELRAQREGVLKAQKEITDKEAELKAREQAVADELKKLQLLRDEITKADTLKKQENQEKVAKIIETIETMSPKASAQLITNLDDTLSVEVIEKMDTAKLAKIMNQLDPKRAAHLNEVLAGIARAKSLAASGAAGATVASNSENTTTKGGENNGEQNHSNSNTTQRQPSSAKTKGP